MKREGRRHILGKAPENDAMRYYEARGLQLNREVSPHLYVREVVCCCWRACGNYTMSLDLLRRWAILRARVGVPVRVTSGFRCKVHEIESNKPAGSYCAHTRGEAIDVAWPGLPRMLPADFIAQAGRLFKCGGMGLYLWGLHLDVRTDAAHWWDPAMDNMELITALKRAVK